MTLHDVLTAKRNWHVENCDVLDGLRMLPDRCMNAVVTSPPYYALRNYLPADHHDKAKEHGSEPTPEAFIETMVAVFAEVRRVLRDDGVCWVNLGDSYAQSGGKGEPGGSTQLVRRTANAARVREQSKFVPVGMKPGDKLNMPHRVAEALQAAGWYWRDTIIWHKLSPMPESVSGWKWVRCKVKVAARTDLRLTEKRVELGNTTDEGHLRQASFKDRYVNGTQLSEWSPCPGCPKCLPNDGWVLRRGKWRCTQAHEYIFQLAKSAEYFCDGEAAKVAASCRAPGNKGEGKMGEAGAGATMNRKAKGKATTMGDAVEFANPRNVWSLSHEPSKEKHFAAYPTELVRRCLLPSLAHAYCAACGAPHAPMVTEERKATRPALTNKIWKHDDGDRIGQRSDDSPNLDPERHIKCSTVVGYKATCSCNAGTTTGIVLDPYCGTGTTGEVALKLGARFIGFELNPDYKAMADRRVKKKLPLFA